MASPITSYSTWAEIQSYGEYLREGISTTTQKVIDVARHPFSQCVMSFGLGLVVHRIYGPLTSRVLNFLGVTKIPVDPFKQIPFIFKIIMTYHVCILGPAVEENMFRGSIQPGLKSQFYEGFKNLGLSECLARAASSVTSIVVTSILFGLIHFANAILILCDPIICLLVLCALIDGLIDLNWVLLFLNPMSYLPQVIAATIMGVIFGLAQEFTAEVYIPISMHIGNNSFAWVINLISDFYS